MTYILPSEDITEAGKRIVCEQTVSGHLRRHVPSVILCEFYGVTLLILGRELTADGNAVDLPGGRAEAGMVAHWAH